MSFHLTFQKILSERLNFRSVLFLLFLFLASIGSFAQSKKDLQNKREELSRRIALTNKLIKENKASASSASQELQILGQQINFREQLIQNMQHEVSSMDAEIDELEAEIELYNDRIDALKNEYSAMIKQAYKNSSSRDAMMYVFSAENFNEAYKRFRFMQNYAQVRKEQAEKILNSQSELQIAIADLELEKDNKQSLVEQQFEERSQLDKDKKKRQEKLQKLQNEQGKLKEQQQQQEAERRKLSKKIEEIIAAELAADRNKTTGKLELTPEGKLVSENFEKNKGQLPWPVSRGLITKKFGKQAHPTIPGITIDNKGIDISTEQGSSVLAVFGGTVTSVFNIPGAGQNVIITHGAYKTVYAGLKNVTVVKGQKVDARESIGVVLTDQGESIIHLEVWFVTSTGGKPQNPSSWIIRRN